MSLKITLKPNETIVINGCVIKNSARRHTMMIENFADIIRGADILKEEDANTPLKRVYFLIQTALLDVKIRDKIVPHIQKQLAELFNIFSSEVKDDIMRTANFVSISDYYKALSSLRPAMKYEAKLLEISK